MNKPKGIMYGFDFSELRQSVFKQQNTIVIENEVKGNRQVIEDWKRDSDLITSMNLISEEAFFEKYLVSRLHEVIAIDVFDSFKSAAEAGYYLKYSSRYVTPRLMLTMSDGALVAMFSPTCGYAGAGPELSYKIMRHLGIDVSLFDVYTHDRFWGTRNGENWNLVMGRMTMSTDKYKRISEYLK